LIEGLRQQFKAEHVLGGDPNTLQYSVWNLSADSRSRLSQQKDPTVELEAGYVGGQTDVIFRGDVERVFHTREGPDWLTKIESGDGARALRMSKVSVSFKSGTKLIDMIKHVGKQMLVDLGNVEQLGTSDLGRKLSEYANGDALFGRAREVMDRLCKAGGLEWRVQDGVLEVSQEGQPFQSQAVLLSSDTGLIGSPEPGEKGALRVVSLIQPGLKPGRKVQVRSAAVDGFYRVSKVSYSGDTHGSDWYAALEVKPL